MSALKTGILMILIFGIFLGIGSFFGPQGMTIAVVLALVLNLITYWFSDKIVLAMYHAHEVTEQQTPQLHGIVTELAREAGLPKPRVYVIESPTPNAFATGRNPEHAAVAVTTGIVNMLNQRELRAVLAHELSHVKNRDILIATVVATIAGAITYLSLIARWAALFGGMGGDRRNGERGNPIALLVLAIVAPLAAMLVQLWISRTREYGADAGGAQLSDDPLALASALKKLEAASQRIPMVDANPATAHMFIVSPFSGKSLVSIFSTHPPVEERVARLEKMAARR